MIWFLRLRLWQLRHRRTANVVSGALAVAAVFGFGLLTMPHLAQASQPVPRPAAHVTAERAAITATASPSATSESTVPDDAPDVTETTPVRMPREVALIGDSLIVERDDDYTNAFGRFDMTVRLDGTGSRSLRYGWLCRHAERLVTLPEPSSPRCRRQGLETVRWWVASNQLRDELVVALGTNDASRRPEDVLWSLGELRSMLGTHPLVLVGTSVVPMRQAFADWNAIAAQWCALDVDCRFLDWAADPAGQDPRHFARDGVHPTTLGGIARAEFIARSLVG